MRSTPASVLGLAIGAGSFFVGFALLLTLIGIPFGLIPMGEGVALVLYATL